MPGRRSAVVMLAVVGLLPAGAAGGQAPFAVGDVTRAGGDVAALARGLASAGEPARAAATWCGTPSTTDRSPNAVAGFPVHWIYGIPSDAPDQLAAFADVMQTDAEAIDAWWRGQDPTRTPRNDLASFSCGLQLDLSTLRLQLTGAQLASGGRFAAIANGLFAAGFRSERTKYVLYYDGPVSNASICGQGGGDPSGFGLAVVYARACIGVSTAAVVAHELLHTFGAVPSGAPNECPPPHEGHTCDNPQDLLHPTIDNSPLETKLLDPGRDDYYGHASALPDVQDVPWLVQLDRQTPLAVTISGPGEVAADVPGLQCAASCTTTWNADTRLSLAATPRSGAKLVGWGGACAGSAGCNVTVTPGTGVSVLFAPLVYRVRVSIAGRGVVRSSRPGITCRPRCAAAFPSYVPVRLTAQPAKGWRFSSWRGACRGTRTVCTLPLSEAASARAVFTGARR